MPGTYAKVKEAVEGEVIKHDDRNAEHDNHIQNADPSGQGSNVANETEMQATSDPYPAESAAIATSLETRLQQIQYVIKQITGKAQWYYDAAAIGTKGADVASANTLPLIKDGNYFDVTGTTAITDMDSLGAGTVFRLHFDDALILTHHATDLILPGGINITTAAGDEAEFVEYAAGDVRCTSYSRAAGTAVQIKSSFSVHKGGAAQNGIVTATSTKITWPTEIFDTGSAFAANAFTPSVAGKYLLSSAVEITAGVDATYIQVQLYKNGALHKSGLRSQAAGTAPIGGSISIVVDANGSTDYFEIYVLHNAGSNRNVSGVGDLTWFTGCKID